MSTANANQNPIPAGNNPANPVVQMVQQPAIINTTIVHTDNKITIDPKNPQSIRDGLEAYNTKNPMIHYAHTEIFVSSSHLNMPGNLKQGKEIYNNLHPNNQINHDPDGWKDKAIWTIKEICEVLILITTQRGSKSSEPDDLFTEARVPFNPEDTNLSFLTAMEYVGNLLVSILDRVTNPTEREKFRKDWKKFKEFNSEKYGKDSASAVLITMVEEKLDFTNQLTWGKIHETFLQVSRDITESIRITKKMYNLIPKTKAITNAPGSNGKRNTNKKHAASEQLQRTNKAKQARTDATADSNDQGCKAGYCYGCGRKNHDAAQCLFKNHPDYNTDSSKAWQYSTAGQRFAGQQSTNGRQIIELPANRDSNGKAVALPASKETSIATVINDTLTNNHQFPYTTMLVRLTQRETAERKEISL